MTKFSLLANSPQAPDEATIGAAMLSALLTEMGHTLPLGAEGPARRSRVMIVRLLSGTPPVMDRRGACFS